MIATALRALPHDVSQGPAGTGLRPGALARWLLMVAGLVVAIVIVGGITRLTESGLSITEWKPLTGAIPPLSEAGWQAEFARYRRIPEYVEINGPAGMTLADYKTIYFWEWLHRLLARIVGLAFAVPLAWFWWRRAIPPGYKPRLLALLALGALQGAIGWWMVTSGLAERTDVSHHRLAAHLLTALVTLGGLVWTALDLRAMSRDCQARPARLTRLGVVALAALGLQLLLGAWMAGLDAGYVAGAGWLNWDAWPLMQGRLWPAGVGEAAFADDPFLIHFLHRWWAWVVVAILVVVARRLRRTGARGPGIAIHCGFGAQILLGIATVMSGVALWLAVLHQAVGALLVIATVWGAHALGRR